MGADAPKPLSGKWRDMLVTGIHSYPTNRKAAFALLLAMANADWDWPEVHLALTESGVGARKWFPSLVKARDWWDKAAEFARDKPAVLDAREARQELGLIKARLDGQVWRGRTAAADRLLLEFAVDYATTRGLLVLPLATRVVAEGTGLSRPTAARALQRLCEAGWLRREQRSHHTDAAVFRLTTPSLSNEVCTDEPRPEGATWGQTVSHECTPAVHTLAGTDVFRSLGRSAATLYAALSGTEVLTVSELVSTSGLARRTAHKWLLVLQQEGLAVKEAGGYLRVEVSDFEALAEAMGVAGAADAQRAAHAQQRASWSEISQQLQAIRRRKRFRAVEGQSTEDTAKKKRTRRGRKKKAAA